MMLPNYWSPLRPSHPNRENVAGNMLQVTNRNKEKLGISCAIINMKRPSLLIRILFVLLAVCCLWWMSPRLFPGNLYSVRRTYISGGSIVEADIASPVIRPNRRLSSSYNASAPIPKILHQTFASEMVYKNYKPLISKCLKLNPDWTYYLWRDSDAEALIAAEYPDFLSHYKKFRDVLERSDSIRYIVLHHFGGIYLDMDVECVKPFFPDLSGCNSFLDQERIEQTNIFWGWPFSVMNSAMGSAPGHPFFRSVIKEMLSESRLGNAFATTGPAVLTRAYNKYQKLKPPPAPVKLLEPKIMSPLMDSNKNWRSMCQGSLSAKSKPEAKRSWRERGCLMLESKNWRYDDTDNATVCVHRFLHLGYGFAAGARKKPFNMTLEFWPRVHFYARNHTRR